MLSHKLRALAIMLGKPSRDGDEDRRKIELAARLLDDHAGEAEAMESAPIWLKADGLKADGTKPALDPIADNVVIFPRYNR